jgi:hypothetical protein
LEQHNCVDDFYWVAIVCYFDDTCELAEDEDYVSWVDRSRHSGIGLVGSEEKKPNKCRNEHISNIYGDNHWIVRKYHWSCLPNHVGCIAKHDNLSTELLYLIMMSVLTIHKWFNIAKHIRLTILHLLISNLLKLVDSNFSFDTKTISH